MSDLYLDLKRTIPVVTEWTTIGTQEMDDAQKRTGLSDERLAHQIHVSSKTWARWKKRGAIPTHDLQRVAPVLGFELVTHERVPLDVSGEEPILVVTPVLRESLATLVDLLQRVAEISERNEATLGRIEQAILGLDGARSRARPRSG